MYDLWLSKRELIRLKNTNSDLKTYIDLHQLIEENRGSHEENRSFGLLHQELLSFSVELLKQWVEAHRHRLPHPSLSEKLSRILSTATLLLLIVSFFLGIFSGIALLSYSGSEPVNLIYFLGAVFFLPLLTMAITLLAMLRANRANNTLIHLSPAYWMERIFIFFTDKNHEIDYNVSISPLITNWIIIRRSQELALAFSLGLFLALLGSIASQDIAFGWSTTLKVTPEAFHHFVSMLALPWSAVLPQAVPSLELIEQSHYFRLGGKLNSGMIENAALLGEWWKFLLMTTLVYALFLRFVLFVLSSIGLKSALKRAILMISGVKDLLREMEESLIESEASVTEKEFEAEKLVEGTIVASVQKVYSSTIGWAFDEVAILLQNDRLGLEVDDIYEVGGLHTLGEDQHVIGSVSGDILFYVKSWEPPTGDFIDFLTDLSTQKSNSISLYPLGMSQLDHEATEKHFNIWLEKISPLKRENIRMIR